MTGTDNMTVVLICFLHNKPYDELCKRAKELNKRYSDDDATVEKNDGNDSLPKCEQNGRVNVESSGGGGGDTPNVNTLHESNGAVTNVVSGDNERLMSDETIPSTDGASNVSDNVTPSGDDKLEKKDELGEAGANDDPKIIQESKKFKETDSEDELK